MADYNSSLTAQEIESTLLGAVVHNKQTYLTEQEKAQARKNIGAGSSDNGMKILGFFSTLDDLKAGVPNPSAGDAYGVGESYPYNIYIWDGLHSMWVNNGNIRGADGEDGEDGADAVITPTQVEAGLGYNPGMVNPNLLDNWYFGNPVNQRGQTEYSGVAQYTIDRWKGTNSAVILTVNSAGYIVLSVKSGYTPYLLQPFVPEIIKAVLGKTVTLSVLLADGTLCKATSNLPTVQPSGNTLYCSISDVADVLSAGSSLGVRLKAAKDGVSSVVAVKLELGSVQTLARQVNGEWVLNEIPDYGEQLARCQRYFQRIQNASTTAPYPFAIANAYASTMLVSALHLPTPMRAYPSISISAADGLLITGATSNEDLVSTGIASAGSVGAANGFTNRAFNINTTGAVGGNSYILRLKPGAYIDLTADL